MIFSSIFFLFVFLPVTLIIYYLVPMKAKNIILLLVSLIFYAWGEPVYVLLMMFSILFNYLSGIEIHYYAQQGNLKMKKISFIFTVVVNLAMLGFFKYFGFLLSNINAILPIDIPYKAVALPIGISFYTFQTLSYIIDVYRGNVAVQNNIISFGAYVTMFPQLIAGPIVRYSDIDKQLASRKINLYKFGLGSTWFIRGLAKKVLLANNMGAIYDSVAAISSGQRSALTAWVGVLAYSMQIYFDFSGYSDMAIGLGKMLGFDFVKNFDYPYISKSVTEFWRRWHISLGSWFREYVYFPMGGNRVDTKKQIRNIMVVWLLTGLWHGAAWNFILWGIYFGLLLLLERYVLKKWLEKLPGLVQNIYMYLMVLFSWILFAATSLKQAGAYFLNMFGVGGGFVDRTGIYYLLSSAILFIICCFCARPWLWKTYRKQALKKEKYRSYAAAVGYALLVILCVAYLVNATYNPFLYFRF